MTVRDGGTPRLMNAAGGGYYGDVANKVTGRIESKAVLNPLKGSKEAFAVLGPQAVWGLAAFAVGRHFEAEIAARLGNIERKLDHVIEEIDRERLAELDAASRECERAAFKIIDGRNPVDVVAGLSVQKLFIDKNWSLALGALARTKMG
ncbi:MAG: hypothetical protein M5U22_18705 [Thermoleophilia bacterium]|nr:hypothetical protein [Thermoleophilia bacterium]